MDPISPSLNTNQNQKQPPAPPPTLAMSETLHGKNLLMKSGQSTAVPVSRAMCARRARRGQVKNVAWEGGIHLGQLAAVKWLLLTLWMGTTCAPHITMAGTVLAPRVPGRQCSLMALLIFEGVESKPPSVFSPHHTPSCTNPHEHKSFQASGAGAESCNGWNSEIWMVAQSG